MTVLCLGCTASVVHFWQTKIEARVFLAKLRKTLHIHMGRLAYCTVCSLQLSFFSIAKDSFIKHKLTPYKEYSIEVCGYFATNKISTNSSSNKRPLLKLIFTFIHQQNSLGNAVILNDKLHNINLLYCYLRTFCFTFPDICLS